MTPVQRNAVLLAVDVVEGDDALAWKQVAQRLARAVIEFAGTGTLQEQYDRLDEMAAGWSNRVSAAHAALELAGIVDRRDGRLLEAAERIVLLANQRDTLQRERDKLLRQLEAYDDDAAERDTRGEL